MSLESLLLVHTDLCLQPNNVVSNIIVSNNNNNNVSTTHSSDVFLAVALNGAAPYDTITWETTGGGSSKPFELTNPDITHLNVYLTDEFGRSIEPAFDYTISFRISYVSKNMNVRVSSNPSLRSAIICGTSFFHSLLRNNFVRSN